MQVNFNHLDKREAYMEIVEIKREVERDSTLRLPATFYTLSLFYL